MGATASVVVPAYNEELVIGPSIQRIAHTVTTLLPEFTWEIVVVDDGSADETVARIEEVAASLPVSVRLVRHLVNAGLGGALRTAFARTTGDVVVVLDADLSYAPEIAESLVRAWERTHAHVVIASPYMEGGQTIDVPPGLERRSRIANRLLSRSALDDVKTLTGMVRAYDGAFLRSLSLKAVDVDINVEIIYKTQLMRGTILEVPATLSWRGLQHRAGRSRLLSRRSRWNTAKSLVMSYLFRPFWFPLAPAVVFGLSALGLIACGHLSLEGLTVTCLVLAVLMTTSALSMLQAKRYFEEIFTAVLRTSDSDARRATAHPAESVALGGGAARQPEQAHDGEG